MGEPTGVCFYVLELFVEDSGAGTSLLRLFYYIIHNQLLEFVSESVSESALYVRVLPFAVVSSLFARFGFDLFICGPYKPQSDAMWHRSMLPPLRKMIWTQGYFTSWAY